MVRTSVPGRGVPLQALVVLMTWCHPAAWRTPMSVYRVNWVNWTLLRVPKASRRRPKPVTRAKWPTVLTSESLPQQQVILSLGCVFCCISQSWYSSFLCCVIFVVPNIFFLILGILFHVLYIVIFTWKIIRINCTKMLHVNI